MPDRSRARRDPTDSDPPNLAIRVLMQAVDEVAKARGLAGARVAYKRNVRGEHVVALIFTGFEPR